MKFKYTPKPDGWTPLLEAKGTMGEYVYEEPTEVRILVLRVYYDIVLQRWVQRNEQYCTTPERASIIVSNGYARYI